MNKILKYKGLSAFFLLLFAYSFYDAMNSGNSGASDENRGVVYIYLLMMLGWNAIYLLQTKVISQRKNSIIPIMIGMPIWIFVCSLMNGISWVMYVHLFLSVWWISSYQYFYRYTLYNPESIDLVKIFFIIVFFFYVYMSVYAQANIALTRDQEHIVLNYAYNIISFVPIFLLFENKMIRLSLLVIAVVMLFFSYKRGPLLILPIMYFVYILSTRNNSSSKTIVKVLGLLLVVIISFSVADYYSGGYLSSRFSSEELADGSNRSEMWAMAWYDIKNRDLFTLLIGKGSGSSIKLLTSGCHNEWLEFLFSFGVIGVILYFILGCRLIKRYLTLRKTGSSYAGVYGALVVFFWMVGFFSGFYFVHSSFYYFASLGLIESLVYKEQLDYAKR